MSSSGATPSMAELLKAGDSGMDILLEDNAFKTPTAAGAVDDPMMASPQVTQGGPAPRTLVWKETSVQGNKFALPEYYQVVRTLGSGAYGVVCHAVDSRLPDGAEAKQVAIKKIGRAFEHAIDAKRTIREVKLLREMKHDNIITLLDVLPPLDLARFNDFYVVYQFMETDLHQIIRSAQELSEDHVQYFVYQILRGIKYVHSLGVVHRDLKPSNLLLNGNCDLRICDFGLARALGPADDHPSFLTEYVATRWYRAPEVLLSWPRYTKALDMWSIGCILAELLGRTPIFPGANFQDQINKICAVLGNPTPQDLDNVTSAKSKQFMRNLPRQKVVSVRERYAHAQPNSEQGKQRAQSIELLEGLLTFDPDRRMTVEQALASQFMQGLHDPEDEPVAAATINSDWEMRDGKSIDTNTPADRAALKEIAYNEIRDYYHGPTTACPCMPSWEEAYEMMTKDAKKDKPHRHHPYDAAERRR
eukprot:Tamp_11984.p1 GENE.Tamp_11984~~Tamp_11984.p1  ORF type:complete len:475 (+),score=81.55 Tamp_11984:118-1542(+)